MNSHLVTGLSVVLLLARDTERTAGFYREVLGLPLVGEVHDDRHRHFACQLGSAYFTIQLATDLAQQSPGHGYDFLQLCFNVASLELFLAHAAAQNAHVLHEPREFEQTRYVTLLDPDGRHVRVMTPWQREG
jgi:catechol 2,3-dioxygenase-like lactoylglutathione lyase family enzyme